MYTEAKLISDVILIKELMMKEGSSLLCFKNPFLMSSHFSVSKLVRD